MKSVSGQELVIETPAKVNITLHILGKRSDGYHDLDTVMQKINLVDTVHIVLREKPGIQLFCPDSDLPADNSNLVWKAAAAFFQESRKAAHVGVSITLEKRIPVAAGLGGGSSDAGAVLSGLNRLTGGCLSEQQLLTTASTLGADVPFFVVPHAAVRATGIGENMEPVPSLDDCVLLLVNPGFSVSTAWVYKNYTLTRPDKVSNLSDSQKNTRTTRSAYALYNDLESVTIKHHPEIADIKKYLLENGASDALMSGSGPTVFGIFPAAGAAIYRCAEQLKKTYGQGVFITRPLVS